MEQECLIIKQSDLIFIDVHENTRGTGYWKLNNSHLESSECKNKTF